MRLAWLRTERDIALNEPCDEKRTRPAPSPAGRASVAFDPGVVREGRITSREAGHVEIVFPPPHRHTLAVGTAARLALETVGPIELPDRRARVVERWDREDERRYRFALSGRRSPARPTPGGGRRAAARLNATLRFGRLELDVDLLDATEGGVVLRVAPSIEVQLCSADAIEVVADDLDRRAQIRLAGWIERRTLERAAVRYQFRVDLRLSDDGAAQHERLRTLLTRASHAARSVRPASAAAGA